MSPAEPSNRHLAIRTLTRLHRQLEATDSGLTLPQYRMLVRLSAGGVQSAKLAEQLTVRKPTITAVAAGLVDAGLAVRETQQGDRRVVKLALTDAGRQALRNAEKAFAERLSPILDELENPERFIDELVEVGGILDARLAVKQQA